MSVHAEPAEADSSSPEAFNEHSFMNGKSGRENIMNYMELRENIMKYMELMRQMYQKIAGKDLLREDGRMRPLRKLTDPAAHLHLARAVNLWICGFLSILFSL